MAYEDREQTSPVAPYAFRYMILGILVNPSTGRTTTHQLSRGRGEIPDQLINDLLHRPAGEIEQYAQLLLVTMGWAEERSGAPLSMDLSVIRLHPTPPWALVHVAAL